MSPRKTLIVCSAWLWVALAACREDAPADGKSPSIDFFSDENTPGVFFMPDVIKLQLKRPVFQYSSAITSDIIPIEDLTVDDAPLQEKLIYYGATGVKDKGEGTWEVMISKYCHYVRGVVRDFAQLDAVASAQEVSTNFLIGDWVPGYFENGHNVMAPRVRVSLEDGARDVCRANVSLRLIGGGQSPSRPAGSQMYSNNPVTAQASQQTGCHFFGISETPGIYDIEVALDGYVSTQITGIEIVLDDQLCHVVQKEVRVTLKKK